MCQRPSRCAPRRVWPHSPRSGSSVLPVGAARLPVPQVQPALQHGVLRPDRCSCALALPFETGIRHQQLLHTDLFVIERNGYLQISPSANQPLNGSPAEAAMSDALALHEARCVLRGLVFSGAVGRVPAHGWVGSSSERSGTPEPTVLSLPRC